MRKTTDYDKARQSTDYQGLWETEDVQVFTGWGRQHISMLCNAGSIPFIPGRPNKFVPEAVRQAISMMQVGGPFGKRRKPKTSIRKAV